MKTREQDQLLDSRLGGLGFSYEIVESQEHQHYRYYTFSRNPLTRQFAIIGSPDQRQLHRVAVAQITTPQTLEQFHAAVDHIEHLLTNRIN